LGSANKTEPVTLKEFILTESFEPVSIPYGFDFKMRNGRWDHLGGFDYTFFTLDGLYYMVTLKKPSGIVSFGTSDENTTDPGLYDQTPYQAKDALHVFNSVIYVALQGAKNLGYKRLRFDAASRALGRVYDAMVRNKFLIDKLAGYGWKYLGKDDDNNHMFGRSK
jgi:hypothetical protein